MHSEFRDGNVPAGREQLRVLAEATRLLPEGVTKLYLRSDTAAYRQDLVKYCAEGKNPRFGVIEFAIGADVTSEFKRAVAELPETAWRGLDRIVDGERYATPISNGRKSAIRDARAAILSLQPAPSG